MWYFIYFISLFFSTFSLSLPLFININKFIATSIVDIIRMKFSFTPVYTFSKRLPLFKADTSFDFFGIFSLVSFFI